MTLSLQRGECPEDLCGIIPVTGEGHDQRGRHVQRKHSYINLHRARILAPSQCLDDLLRLPVIEHVHDVAVAERVRRYRNRKVKRNQQEAVLSIELFARLPLALQTRLLRILQEKEVMPLGGNRSVPVNFALICATHRNLARRVDEGVFREDLLYRLREYAFSIPPLREWPGLVQFIPYLWCSLGAQARQVTLSSELIHHLMLHNWPGNVRQLQSLLKVLLALTDDGECLSVAALPAEYQNTTPSVPARGLQQHEARLIADTLARFNGNVSKAAQALGVARSTLYRRAVRIQGR